MKKIYIAFFLFFCLFSLAAEAVSDDFTRAQEFYRADEDQEAILLFERFLSADPNHAKADDALWYLGRLYRNIGDESIAERLFRTVLADSESNRRTEAFYDLIKMLDKQDREEEILKIVPSVFPDDAADSYALKSVPIVLKSYSLVGTRYRKTGLGSYTESLWLEALDLINLYDESGLDEAEVEMLVRNRVKFLTKLAALAPNPDDFSDYSSAAEAVLVEYSAAFPYTDAGGLREDLDDLHSVYRDFDMNAAVLADYNGMTGLPGLFAEAGLGGDLELERKLLLGWKLDYRHDSFDFKTFNFNALKTGDERYFEVTDRFSGDLELGIGSKYFFFNRIAAGLDLTFAEDPGDFNYGGDLSWDLSKDMGRSGVLFLDNGFSVSIFPDYQNDGRKISSIRVSVSPGYTFVFQPGWSLNIGYGFDYKYYLNAHYDTIDKGVDPDTRRYYIHDAAADLRISPFKWLDLKLDYNFRYLDSVNYDLWLYGDPENRFVTDFYDHYQNSIGIDIDVDHSIYSGSLRSGFSLRRFVNYPARDAARVFINELRTDTEVFVGMENRFELFRSPKTGTFSAALDGYLNKVSSNHTYEVSYVTNYFNWEISLGIEWVY